MSINPDGILVAHRAPSVMVLDDSHHPIIAHRIVARQPPLLTDQGETLIVASCHLSRPESEVELMPTVEAAADCRACRRCWWPIA